MVKKHPYHFQRKFIIPLLSILILGYSISISSYASTNYISTNDASTNYLSIKKTHLFTIRQTTYHYKKNGPIYDAKDNKLPGWCGLLVDENSLAKKSLIILDKASSYQVLYIYNEAAQQLYFVKLSILTQPSEQLPPVAQPISNINVKIIGFVELPRYLYYNKYLLIQDQERGMQGIALVELWHTAKADTVQQKTPQAQNLQPYNAPRLTDLKFTITLTGYKEKLLYLDERNLLFILAQEHPHFYRYEGKRGKLKGKSFLPNGNQIWLDTRNNCLYEIMLQEENNTEKIIKQIPAPQNKQFKGIGIYDEQLYIVLKSRSNSALAAAYHIANLDDNHQIVINNDITVRTIDTVGNKLIAETNGQYYFCLFECYSSIELFLIKEDKTHKQDKDKKNAIHFWHVDGNNDFYVIELALTNPQKAQIVYIPTIIRQHITKHLLQQSATDFMVAFYYHEKDKTCKAQYELTYMYPKEDLTLFCQQIYVEKRLGENVWQPKIVQKTPLKKLNVHTITPEYQLFKVLSNTKPPHPTPAHKDDIEYVFINTAKKIQYWLFFPKKQPILSYAIDADKQLLLLSYENNSLFLDYFDDMTTTGEQIEAHRIIFQDTKYTQAKIASANGQFQLHIKYRDYKRTYVKTMVYPIEATAPAPPLATPSRDYITLASHFLITYSYWLLLGILGMFVTFFATKEA